MQNIAKLSEMFKGQGEGRLFWTNALTAQNSMQWNGMQVRGQVD